VCERELATATPEPRTLEERLVAATVAINAGDYDRALTLLARVLEEAPDHDHARYMAGVAHALRREPEAALDQLRRAIALNPENRALARQDPDLAGLHGLEAFRELLEAPAPPAGARRRRR
jgi:tetratricopeptide (TPR) repeat protein